MICPALLVFPGVIMLEFFILPLLLLGGAVFAFGDHKSDDEEPEPEEPDTGSDDDDDLLGTDEDDTLNGRWR